MTRSCVPPVVRGGAEHGLPGAAHERLARRAVLRQEIARARGRRPRGRPPRRECRPAGTAACSDFAQQPERRNGGAGGEEGVETAAHRREHVAQRGGAAFGHGRHRPVGRALREIAPQDRGRHQAPVEQRRQARLRAAIAQLREHERHVLVLARHRAAGAQRAVERLVDEPRHLGLVGHREARIEVGLERELAQQRQAEGVDRAHGDVAGAIAQLAPARRGNLAALGRDAERRQDALAHFGRGLPGEGHRQDVRRVHARAQQVDVAVHQHARLAGPGRGLERDVEAGIDGALARGAVARVDARVERGVAAVVVERQPRSATHRRRSPCGRPTSRRSSGTIAARTAGAGTRRGAMPSSTACSRARASISVSSASSDDASTTGTSVRLAPPSAT